MSGQFQEKGSVGDACELVSRSDAINARIWESIVVARYNISNRYSHKQTQRLPPPTVQSPHVLVVLLPKTSILTVEMKDRFFTKGPLFLQAGCSLLKNIPSFFLGEVTRVIQASITRLRHCLVARSLTSIHERLNNSSMNDV